MNMKERYRYYPDKTLYVHSEFDALKTYDTKVQQQPHVTRNGREYVLSVKTDRVDAETWLMKYDSQGLIHLNPRWIFLYPYNYLIGEYLDGLFNLVAQPTLAYSRYRLFAYTKARYLYGRRLWTTPGVKHYVIPDGMLQEEPIIITTMGDLISGGIQYLPKIAKGYTTRW
jgi:hypothetical protein